MINQKTKNNGESLSGKSVNRNLPIHLLTYSPIYRLTHSPIHPFTHKNGITLIEMVLGMVLIGIIALVVANALSTGITGFFVVDNRKEALDQGRIALDRMAKEIRNVRSSSNVWASSDGTNFCFTNTDGTTMGFRFPGLSANTIARQDGLANLAACPGVAGNTLSANIASLTFAYIQANGTPDATFSSVTTKKIRITATSTVSGESVELTTEVWPRNL